MIKPSCARTDSLNKCHFCRKMGSKQRRHRAFQVFFLLALRSPHESTYPNRFPGFAVYCHWSFTALQLRCRSAHTHIPRENWYRLAVCIHAWLVQFCFGLSVQSCLPRLMLFWRCIDHRGTRPIGNIDITKTRSWGSKRGKSLYKEIGPQFVFLGSQLLGSKPGRIAFSQRIQAKLVDIATILYINCGHSKEKHWICSRAWAV